ncbi:MAG TPA: formate dehydrogenase subunit gamma [Geobacteraceae bacterium]|nr:formate dehydrogenase subunit gamma [Geobacteraceae bacterium]
MKNDPKKITRYMAFERANHWLSAILFILAALSGLALFQPAFVPLSQLFGGGTWTRILHPFIGVAMLVSFGVMAVSYWKPNIMTPADWEWLRRVPELAGGDDRNMPEAGKFNGGQKMLFWLLVICMALLILSGIVMWRAYFSFIFPLWLIALASVIHAIAATIMIALLIFHIYAAIWTRESIDAMMHGQVRRAWAKQHHPAWYREMIGGEK